MLKGARAASDGEAAEALAVSALLFLTEDRSRIARFLDATGMDPGSLSAAASDPGMLGAVLDFILADESLLLVFAAEKDVDPAMVEPARMMLAGGPVDPDRAARAKPSTKAAKPSKVFRRP